MGYRVKGTLKLPDGSPASNAEIEFISRKNFSPLVQELKSNMLCGPTGAYDVTLEFGEYAVMVYPGGTYPAALGTITLATDTVTGQDLPSLLQQSGWQPATPEYIQQIAAWLAEANASATSSAASAGAAKVSETNAKSSENAALSSKNSAASSASTATTKAAEATSSASAALASKNAAATSETNALSSKNAAAASASTATSAASSATSSASAAEGSESTALSAATRAEQAAQAVTGALIDAGPYNAGSGALPAPITASGVKRSSIWKVTGGGTAGGIELGVGDSLVYTSSDDSYYKIDNTESVSSVNGKSGVVTVSSFDVGADPSGTAQNLISQHAAKSGAHQISGVSGLQASLDSKFSASNKPNYADINGLGTAAVKNFGENPGQLMEVGAFGLGAVDSKKITSLAALARSGFHHTDAATMGQDGGLLSYHAIYNMISSSAAMRLICPFNSPDIKIQIFSGGWGAAYSFLHTGNSVKDANGFWKGASPVVRVGFYGDEDGFTLCGDGARNDEAAGALVARHAVGVYRITGSGGFASDGWHIETPQDANGNKLRFVEYEYINGIIEIRTFEPTYTNGRCEKGVAADIPAGRWVDVRLSMPPNKIGN